jgi:PAS domain S-box-containing protein
MRTTMDTTSTVTTGDVKKSPTPKRGQGTAPSVVLVVDDVADNLLALEGMLRRDDVEIVTARSGRDALEILLGRDVAVAIIDVMMPEMDGFELAELIRGVERTRRVPIIFVTAASKAEYRAFTGYQAGAIDFLFKPLDQHVLRAKVDVLVSLERQQREAERARAETEVLLRFAQATSRSETAAGIYDPALDAASDLLGAERSAILLFDESDRMQFEAWRGLSDTYRAAVDGHSPWPRDEKDPKTILISDVTKDDRMVPYQGIFAAETIGSIGFVPIVSDRLLGKFMLYWERPRTFSEHDEVLALTIASQFAGALERLRLREAERVKSDELQAVFDIAPVQIWYGDAECRAFYGNRWAYQEHGLRPGSNASFDAPISQLPQGLRLEVHGRALQPHEMPMQIAARTGERVEGFEHDVIHTDGRRQTMIANVAPLFAPDGTVRGVVGVYLDITARKQIEEALRSSEARLRSVIDQFPAGVGVMDREGKWIITNPTLERYVPHGIPSILPEHTSHWLFVDEQGEVIPPENWPGQRALRGESVLPGMEGTLTEGDGRKIWMRVSAAPLYGESGEIVGATAVVQDITVHKQLEQAREAAAAELRQTLHYNEIFAGVLAHDLRNPLNAIQTATQLVLHREHGKADLTPLRRVLASGDRMARMIDQLLDFTKTRVGSGFEVHAREANLSQLCAQVLGEIELAYPAWMVKVDSVGELTGTWDPDRLLQVVSNLVTNAGQHGTAGAEIQIALDGTARDAVGFQVQNKGNIPEALLSDIFAPFRGTRDLRSSTSGLGLGIYIAREIVRAHGGTIEVASSEAEGTTFSVRLPRHAQQPSQAHTHDHESPGEGDGAAAEQGSWKGGWVLVVEDDRDQAELCADICAQAGLNVMTAATGGQAYRKARDLEPALIVLDLALPDTDGWDICRRLKRDERTRSIPIVILTASNDPDSVKRATQVGCAGYLRKPCPPADLVATIHRALGDRAVVSH